MKAALNYLNKFLNYTFKSDLPGGYVRTANLMKVYERIVNKPSSGTFYSLNVWCLALNGWLTKYLKERVKYEKGFKNERFNRLKILKEYRADYDVFLDYMEDLVNTRILPREEDPDPETDFYTFKLIKEQYDNLLRRWRADKDIIVQSDFKTPVYKNMNLKLKYQPIQHFKRVVASRKGHKGFYRDIVIY